jgi:hypothetical protein
MPKISRMGGPSNEFKDLAEGFDSASVSPIRDPETAPEQVDTPVKTEHPSQPEKDSEPDSEPDKNVNKDSESDKNPDKNDKLVGDKSTDVKVTKTSTPSKPSTTKSSTPKQF